MCAPIISQASSGTSAPNRFMSSMAISPRIFETCCHARPHSSALGFLVHAAAESPRTIVTATLARMPVMLSGPTRISVSGFTSFHGTCRSDDKRAFSSWSVELIGARCALHGRGRKAVALPCFSHPPGTTDAPGVDRLPPATPRRFRPATESMSGSAAGFARSGASRPASSDPFAIGPPAAHQRRATPGHQGDLHGSRKEDEVARR